MKTLKFLLLLILTTGISYGQNWQTLNSGVEVGLIGIFFTSDNIGYAVGGEGKIIKTTDAGNTWQQQNSGVTVSLTKVFFVDANTGYCGGFGGTILKTTNAGNIWVNSNPAPSAVQALCFTDSQTGFAVGNGFAMKTINGGSNWTFQELATNNPILTSVIFNQGKGFIGEADAESNLLFSMDDGNTWQNGKTRNGVVHTYGTSFLSESLLGYLVGTEQEGSITHPLINKTVDNGNQWNSYIMSSASGMLRSVAIPNDLKACAVGKYIDDPTFGNTGLIMTTVDGGINWSSQSVTFVTGFSCITKTNSAYYITGSYGVILKSDHTTGISNINLEIPASYTLSQNFPNPFNPETNIKFSISQSGNVKLTVFDITGKEVESLVNEKLSAGTYAYNFNASNLPSGTYFYKIETDNFVETKKMVLIK